MKKVKHLISFIVFCLIFAILLSFFDTLLCRKTVDGSWNFTKKITGFYNSPENEYDVLFLGSSNTYCSFNPLEIWKETGVKSYVLATQQQPLWATYYYLKSALERQQNVKLCVVDVLMTSYENDYFPDGVTYTYLDDFPLTLDKLKLIKESAPFGERFRLLFRIMKYHNRWESLTEEDFNFDKSTLRDYAKGFCIIPNVSYKARRVSTDNVQERKNITDKNIEYLQKIIDLCKEKGVELMLVKTPSNITENEKKYYNSVYDIAKKNSVQFRDYNLDSAYKNMKLYLDTDFCDVTHLNVVGAEKFTKYFIKTTNFFYGKKLTDVDETWEKDYKIYQKEKEELKEVEFTY